VISEESAFYLSPITYHLSLITYHFPDVKKLNYHLKMKPQIVAAIDIGSNSVKLAVAEISGDSLSFVRQERERVRLDKILRERFLSPESIEKSAAAVEKFRAIATRLRAETIIAVATASAREATNSDDFVGEIRRRTGIRVTVLAALEEARLIGLAARHYFQSAPGTLLNVDIGGGSTELSLMKTNEPEKLFSMRLGAVGLTEKFVSDNPPTAREIENLRGEISRRLEKPATELNGENWQSATGTSGTILKFAALLNRENGEIDFARLVELNRELARMTVAERAALPNISEKRAELLVAGGLILEGVMQALKIEKIQPCAYALREGVIFDYLESNRKAVEIV
jgi:exopolyphosphatase/guanosine-5'-triphosphate,3'-diphosphate pyrophosphatase